MTPFVGQRPEIAKVRRSRPVRRRHARGDQPAGRTRRLQPLRFRRGAEGSGAARGRGWAANALGAFGARAGSAEYLELGALANRNPPELDTHDRYGRRVDLVRFHPAYHALMKASIEEGLHSSPWTEPREGAHVARAARSYMQTQVEAGHGCPITMTFAATPCLKLQPDLASNGCRRSRRASTIRATFRPSRSRA